MRLAASLLTLCALLFATACSSNKKARSTPDGGDAPDGGNAPLVEPALDAAGHCPADPALLQSPFAGEGQATSRVIRDRGDLLSGDVAIGGLGDILMRNDRVHIIVQRPVRTAGPGPFGGTVIDAQRLDAEGMPAGEDAFGEMPSFFRFGLSIDAERVEVIEDGSAGGAAIVAATGPVVFHDTVDIEGIIEQALGLPLEIALGPSPVPPMVGTTWYALWPGSSVLRVVTSLCNRAPEDIPVLGGDLFMFGGETDFFNVDGSADGVGTAGFNIDPSRFLASFDQSVAYGYIFGSESGSTVTVSGVTGTLQGEVEIADVLSGDLADSPDLIMAPSGGVGSWSRDLVIGRDVGDIAAAWAQLRGVATGRLRAQISGAGGADARVLVQELPSERVFALLRPQADASVLATLPAGRYRLQVALPGVAPAAPLEVEIAAGAESDAGELPLLATGTVAVALRNAAGGPSPGRVTVLCTGACNVADPRMGDHRFFGISGSRPAMRQVGTEGSVEIALAPGTYRVVASRGSEYVVREAEVTVAAGAREELSFELLRAVDSSGWIATDTHVHAITSPDSPVPLERRVRGFMAEGIDLLISTDHDVHTDFAPTVARLGAQNEIATMIGVESTTFTYGHFNAFPVRRDGELPNGGAFDWAQGRNLSLAPAQLWDALRALGSDAAMRVGGALVQVNHARGGLSFDAIRLDAVTGTTATSPEPFKIDPSTVEPPKVDGDTGLFADRFDAYEVLQAFDDDRVDRQLSDLFVFWSRGFTPVGTASSDTHYHFDGDLGQLRTYVAVEGSDAPGDFDEEAFVRAFRDAKVCMSTAPVLRVSVGTSGAGPGGTASMLAAGEIEVVVEAEAAARFDFVRVDLFDTSSVQNLREAPVPAVSEAVEAQDLSLEAGLEGGERRILRKTLRLPVQADGWVAVQVMGATGDSRPSLFPAHLSGDAITRAICNPTRIDVGGDGWTPTPASVSQGLPARKSSGPAWQGGAPRRLTPALLQQAFRRLAAEHEDH